MKRKKVTIITVTINRKSLKEACESIDRQTYENYHHIVIGDGVLPTLYDSAKRTIIGFSKVMGISEPGANMPNGSPNPIQRWALKYLELDDYVCFLDDDNVYEEKYLEVMVDYLNQNPKSGIALCGAVDLRYNQPLDGYPENYRCDNSAFLARREVVKAIEFPRASMDKNVIQDCEYIRLCANKFGFVNVPYKLLKFGTADNIPPDRGKINFLESWKEPQKAYELASKNKFNDAVKILKKAVKLNKNDAWSWNLLFEIYLITNQKEKASEIAEIWRSLADGIKQDHHYLNFLFAQHFKYLRNNLYKDHVKTAIKLISDEIKTKNEYEYNYILSYYYLFNKDVSQATECFKIARRYFPQNDFWAYKELKWQLKVLNSFGDMRKAIQEFSKLLEGESI